jgi:4-aminobutyrate aminotransferase / (S)-3-amino-2-methylpropionate transaminase / 5-aminovalerate transaminase
VGHIQINTEVPGPKSQELLARRAKAVSNGMARATDVVVDYAEGALVHDIDGNTFIDMAGGIGAVGTEHCPPSVVAAIKEQAERLIHICSIMATYEPYVELCEMLNELAPGDFPKKTLLANSGSEAVENSIKFARSFTGRPAVISFEGAYHGRTLMALSLTSKYNLFKKGFGPFAPEVYRLPVPYLYRKPEGMEEEEYLQWTLWQLENAFTAQVDPSAVAAMIIEPVQGEAGFLPVPPAFLSKIRELCDRYGIVMIADEVQCGMGRTGKLFAVEHYGIAPDLILTAKSLGSGMPISATTGRAEILDAPHPGGVGGTYGGNPLACVSAIETLKILQDSGFQKHAAHVGSIIREILNDWKARYDIVGDVRGLGPMMLVEFVKNRETKEPATDIVPKITRHAWQNGVITIRAGLYTNCIRFLPPLSIEEDQLREAFAIVEQGIIAATAPA